MYFLNIWPKITPRLLSLPRFHFWDNSLLYLSKTCFLSFYLSKTLPNNFPIPLILPYTFLGCHGFLNTSNHVIYLMLTRVCILGLKTCKNNKKSGMEQHVHVYMERKWYDQVSNLENMMRMIFIHLLGRL